MTKSTLIQCFIVALLTQSTLALPKFDRRSGIFGMGDAGGDNRDESFNQIINVIGDSFMNGENNDFSPKSAVGGIDGLGSALTRRSGVFGIGDVGGKNRDESINQAINVIGDSFMNGKNNRFGAESTTGGISGVALNRVRRSGVFGLGDTGGKNRDESLNQAINVIGDSFMGGKNNRFAPESTTGGISGLASSRVRRSGIFGMGDTGGDNRDESLNQIINVIGDSFMDGENNDFSPKSAVGGIDGLGSALTRRSGVFGMGDSGGQNTDNSSNQSVNTIGDSLMAGSNNVFNPQSLVGGVTGASGLGFRRRGLFGLGESGSTNADSSNNENLFIKGDSIMSGQFNSFVPSVDVGGISGVGSSHVRRSGIFGLGDTGSSNSDSSINQNLGIFGDSIMDGAHNTFGPSAKIKGVDGVGTSHVRRGLFGLGESGSTNADSSNNQNLFSKGDSIMSGQFNNFVPSVDVGGVSGVGSSHVRRSGILGLGDTGSSNSDSSQNQNLAIFGDSILSGEHNTFGPTAKIAGIDGVGRSVVH
jgi:hypothetical protein